VVHGARIGARARSADGGIVLDGGEVGEGALVGAGAVVPPEAVIPAGMLAVGVPAEVKRPLAGTPAEEWVRENPKRYAWLRDLHRGSVRAIAE